jgi:hypothetical protein
MFPQREREGERDGDGAAIKQPKQVFLLCAPEKEKQRQRDRKREGERERHTLEKTDGKFKPWSKATTARATNFIWDDASQSIIFLLFFPAC